MPDAGRVLATCSRSEDFEDGTSLRSAKTEASLNSALQRERRPVTLEVAGASPVAPDKVPANWPSFVASVGATYRRTSVHPV
jgi:hypothetical protein